MRSIKSKILTLIISGLLITTLSIGTIAVLTTNRILHQDADIIINTICQREGERINHTLDSVEKSVTIMANRVITELESADSLTDEAYREEFTSRMKVAFTNVAKNTPGVIAYYLRFEPNLTTPTSGFFTSVWNDGKVIVDNPTTDLSLYQTENTEFINWYTLPTKSGKSMWIEPYPNTFTGDLMFSYVIPLYKNDKLIGVTGMDVDYAFLTDIVDSISLYDTGCSYLTDQNDNLLHHKNDDHDITTRNSSKYATSKIELANSMMLVITAPYEDILKNGITLTSMIVIASLLILVFFIVITIYITSRIVNPLKKLVVVAEDLVDGKSDSSIDLASLSDDETGTLARALKRTSEKLEDYMNYVNTLAYRDSLTGVKNRTAYIDHINKLSQRMADPEFNFGLIIADINWLKETNDTYGHDVGSRLIIHASRIICNTFKHSPVFRIGGDEFAIVLEGKDLENHKALIEKLDFACKASSLDIGGHIIPVSIAKGVAIYDREFDKSFNDLFHSADQAMYVNKHQIKSTEQ